MVCQKTWIQPHVLWGEKSECFNKSWVGWTMQASSTNSWPSCGRLWEPPTVVTVQVFILIVVAAGAYVDWVLPVCQPLCRDFFPWTSLHAKFLMGQVYYYSHLTAKETKPWMVDWSPNVMQVQNGGPLILKQAFWPPSTALKCYTLTVSHRTFLFNFC